MERLKLSGKMHIDPDLLDRIEDCLDNYSDCEGNGPADARPNDAMRLLNELRDVREKKEKKAMREVTFQVVLKLREADEKQIRDVEAAISRCVRNQLIFTDETASVAKLMDREV